MNAIRIIRPGPLATVQDLGRYGFQDRGVPVSGAMDRLALRAGNLIVGGEGGEAGIEVTLGGFKAELLCDVHFAVTGADLDIRLNDRPVANWTGHFARKGDVLTLDRVRFGCRSYVCLAGGVDVPVIMGSRSTYLRGRFGGLEGRPLRKDDALPCGAWAGPWSPLELPAALIPPYCHEPVLRVIMGPQNDYFADEGIETFLSGSYELTGRWDRMGCALSGPVIKHRKGADIVSDGIMTGAVQVPGNGLPTVLMADCQTAGGYAKIAAVASFDLPLLAQLTPGARARFQAIDLIEAREIHLKQEYLLRRLHERARSSALGA